MINPFIGARTVAEAVTNGAWIEDIKNPINIQNFRQILSICEEISSMVILPEIAAHRTWTWDAKGIYTAKSLYQAHFQTTALRNLAPAIWR
jgi:hypothetical protein